MIAVLDTNVLVSGLLMAHSAPARLVDMALLGRLACVFDDRILDEYREVLARPRFAAALAAEDRGAVLWQIARTGRPVLAEPLPGLLPGLAPDPGDLPFAEVAVAGQASAIITGNVRHFAFFVGNPWGVEVLTPAQAMERLCAAD